MKIKVCGMRDPENIKAVAALPIDLMGFIFYEKSPRNIDKLSIANTPPHISRVGVFVNADIDFIIHEIKTHNLNFIQLHGDETPEYCHNIQAQAKEVQPSPTLSETKGIQLIKAFRVDKDFDFKILEKYENCCTYFLFDTKAKYPHSKESNKEEYGGTGKKFDWNILEKYKGDTPFLLSGGIGEADAEAIQNLNFNNMIGIDLNSKFEIEPAVKDVHKIFNFLNVLTC